MLKLLNFDLSDINKYCIFAEKKLCCYQKDKKTDMHKFTTQIFLTHPSADLCGCKYILKVLHTLNFFFKLIKQNESEVETPLENYA